MHNTTNISPSSPFHTAEEEQLSLLEICEILSISTATARNWLRLGRLESLDDGAHFSKSYIQELSQKIKSGEDTRLKSRRNKKSVTGKALYQDYIEDSCNLNTVEHVLSLCPSISEEELRIVLAHFAVQLYEQSCGVEISNCHTLSDYLDSAPVHDTFHFLLADLMGTNAIEQDSVEHLQEFFACSLSFIPGEDTLGFLYLSLKDLGMRKSSGAYYTPARTVHSLIESIWECSDASGKTFCDPCCGTGNFLMGLVEKGVLPGHIYGQDMDEISLQITRINLFLLCPQITKEELYAHFICGNTLKATFPNQFDIILGNPPWGSSFSREEVKFLLSKYEIAKKKGMESFDLFVERGISMVKRTGILAFVLPESILNVASHLEARKLLMENCSFSFVTYLGNVFSGVQCPAILLGVTLNGSGSTIGCKVKTDRRNFTIMQQRGFENGILSLHVSDEENDCLESISSIPNAAYLKNNAQFALGIVTGNNKEYIRTEKKNGYETVLKGSNIRRYHIEPGNYYIQFTPEKFQQTAPAELYRAPEKLLYRFISEVPVFAYDNAQRLSLNSCNILIPQIEGLQIKYVLAILNSSVAAYYLSIKFRSVKLLRSHLEQVPIPIVSVEEQEKIVTMVDDIMRSEGEDRSLYEELDGEIMRLYGLTESHMQIIHEALEGEDSYPLLD